MADFWIIKLNAEGVKVWEKVYGGEGNDNLASILPTPDGGYLLAGNSDSNITGEKTEVARGQRDFWIVKINSDGAKVWDRTYGGAGDDVLNAIIPAFDGGYLLGGVSTSGIGNEKSESSRGSTDYWVVKVNLNGDKLWDSTIGGSGDDNLFSMISLPGSAYMLGGNSNSGAGGDKSEESRGSGDFWVVKLQEAALLGLEDAFNLSAQQVQVYPNPSQGEFNIAINRKAAGVDAVTYTLYNNIGQPVLQKNVEALQVQNGVKVSTTGLAKGVYQLQVVLGAQIVTKKLVLQD